jgi:pimeloyl-ACP methyl ester carboxylesterase
MATLPLVLLHAFPLNRSMWREVADALAPSVALIAPDLPGLGGTGVPDGEPSLDVSADQVATALAEAGHQRAVLAGVSMGGYVAMAFARRHRSRLAGLALIDTKAGADGEAARANREQAAQRVTGPEGTTALLPMLEGLLGRSTHAARPELVSRVRELVLSAPPAGVAWSQRAMARRPDSTELLRTLDVPAAVVVGEEDTLTPLGDAHAMAEALPDAVLTVVPAAGHLAAMEDPAAVAAALTALMLRVRPGA